METVVPTPDDTELHLLTEWGTLTDPSRGRKAAVLSVAAHGVLIGILWLVPPTVTEPPPEMAKLERVTPLIEPPTELTQRAPNKTKPSKEFNAEQVLPRPRIQIPSGAPSTTRPQAPRPAPVAQPPVPKPTADLPEPPKVDVRAPKPEVPQIAQVTPQIQPEEKPKLVLQNPAPAPNPLPPGQGRIAIPNPSVSEAIRQNARGGAAGGPTVGDELTGPGGIGEGINLPPAPGLQGSQLELLSDPQGVDFRPYLTQILAAVRRNWMAVMPESARLGRQGRVSIQFSIARDGNVPKLVILMHSGTDALDRAAVAGISASQSFPPFPPGFKGDRIVLQFNFAYNMPRR